MRNKIRNFGIKIFELAKKHKKYTIAIVVVLAVVGYFGYKSFFVADAVVNYVNGKVERGVLSTTISGSGQVSSANQLELKAEASGELIYLNAKQGAAVKAGERIASIDATDALKTLRDAEYNLETAKLSLEKLKAPTDELSLLQSQHSLDQAIESKAQSEESLKKTYEDGFNTISNVFLDLPSIMTGAQGVLYDHSFDSSYSNVDWYANQANSLNQDQYDKIVNYRNNVITSYLLAEKTYNASFEKYKNSNRYMPTADIEALIVTVYDTAKLISDMIKNEVNYVDYVKGIMESSSYNITIPTAMTTHQTSLSSYTSKTNSHLLSLMSIKNSIESSKNNITNASRTIAEKEISLKNLESGPDVLDLRSQELSVRQKENAVAEARANLADYSVRAPFGGIIAKCNVQKNDQISAGTSVVTFITTQKIATISLNEVDVAKVKAGQRVTLTFDAIDELTVSGEVGEVDEIGTTSQGVVSYSVKILFDVQDERVKPGMSVSANIILSSKPDVLLVSSGAIKIKGSAYYVEQLAEDGVTLTTKTIEIGDSNGIMTEIISGLAENDEIVVQKITSSAASSASSQSAAAQKGGAPQGEMFRMMR